MGDNYRRYIFGGHAIVAEIHRPEGDCGIVGATALPVTGGCARVDAVGPQDWEIPGVNGRNSFQSGSAFVSGVFTAGEKRASARTNCRANLSGLTLLDRLSVDALSIELTAEVSSEEDEPKFAFGPQDPDPIRGLKVDNVPVHVEFDRSAVDVPFEALREKFQPLIPRRLVKLSFPEDRAPSADVAIEDGNIIKIAGVQVHFGELLIGRGYRRVTLFRVQLDPEMRQFDCGIDVASGPQGWPP